MHSNNVVGVNSSLRLVVREMSQFDHHSRNLGFGDAGDDKSGGDRSRQVWTSESECACCWWCYYYWTGRDEAEHGLDRDGVCDGGGR